MILPWDESYKRTKAIKTGAASLEPPFSDLVDWLNTFYDGIGALSAWYDHPSQDRLLKHPALRIVFEREAAIERLSVAPGRPNPSEEARIKAKFEQILSRRRGMALDTNGLFVTYSAFEFFARWEANSKVGAEDLLHLKTSLADLNVWEIKPDFDAVTFFFETDEQLAESEENGAQRACETLYRSVISRYDEFGYFRDRPIEVSFYSHQSFNRVYQSWFNWSRR